MQRLNITILSGLLIIGLAGCSTSPESDPAYISPNHYMDYNCKQLSAEKQRVSTKMKQMTTGKNDTADKVMDTALAAFAISQGYGFSSGDDDVAYRRLYNQYEVLEQTAIKKECY